MLTKLRKPAVAASLVAALLALIATLAGSRPPEFEPHPGTEACQLVISRGLSYVDQDPAPVSSDGVINVARGERESVFIFAPASAVANRGRPALSIDDSDFPAEVFRLLPIPIGRGKLAYDVMVPLTENVDAVSNQAIPVYVADITIPQQTPRGRHAIQFRLGDCVAVAALQVFDVSLPEVTDLIIQATVDSETPKWPAEFRSEKTGADVNGYALQAVKTALDYGVSAFAGVFPRITEQNASTPRGQEIFSALVQFLDDPAVRYFRLPVTQYNRKSTYRDRRARQPGAKSFRKNLAEELAPYSALLEDPQYVTKLLVKLWDEPVPANYEEVAAHYAIARELLGDVPLELAEQPESAIAGIADIWTVHIDYLLADDVRREHAAGNQVFLYANALHAIQRNSDTMRSIGWLLWRYDLDGYHFWRLNWWHKDPWTTSSGWRTDFNKTGTLVYPAPEGQVYASVRLLAFREGLEDAALLRQLDDCTPDMAARTWIRELEGEILATSENPVTADLYAARGALLRHLEDCKAGRSEP